MTTLVTPAFEREIADKTVNGGTIHYDEFIFALIPNLTADNLNQHLAIPESQYIKHRQAVSKAGVINENAVVYSVTVGTEVGDFEFNWIGLVNRATNQLCAAVQTDRIRKTRNKNNIQGNSITRNILLEFSKAKQLTGINVDANTWQIDFTVRLHGIDEKIRLTNRDLYGSAVFFDESFLVRRKTGNQYSIEAGVAYIEGVRADLTQRQNIQVQTFPAEIYVDIVHHCSVTGAYETEVHILKQARQNYVDNANRQHYVHIIAEIDQQGNVIDRRLFTPWNNLDFIPNSKKSDAVDSSSSDTVATSRAVKNAYDLANSKQSPATTLSGYGITDFQVKSAAGNLNDYRTAGIYSFNSLSNSQNRPGSGFTGNLQVITGGTGNESWCHQIFRRHYSGEVYERWQTSGSNNNWSEWKRTDNQDGLPIGSIVSFPKEITNARGFLRCTGGPFNERVYPDLYQALGNKNKTPNLQRSDVGMLAYFPTDTIPEGWIAFDSIRSVVNATSYPELYRYLIAKYRSISNVPLAEDRFIRNAGNGLGVGETQKASVMAVNDNDNAVMGVRLINDDNNYRSVMATFGLDPIHSRDYANVAQVYANRDVQYSQLASEDNTGNNPYHQAGGVRPKSVIFKLCIKAKNSFDDVQFWIKAFGEVVNVGQLDASRLAQDLQQVRSEKANIDHTHTVAQITDFAQGVAGQFSYQRIGNFTIRKFPDGTMLQTYVYEVNDLTQWEEKTFTWAVAFNERPLIIGNITSSANNSSDQGINILSKSTATAVYYRLYEHWSGNQGLCRIQFFAVGRWL